MSHTEKVQRHEHRVYRGNAFIRRHGRSEWAKAGWARITMHRDGERPLFEGAFRIDGDHHHIHTGSNYQRVKHFADPEPDSEEDWKDYMVVWKDSDIITNYNHLAGAKRDVQTQPYCDTDTLSYNAGITFSSLMSHDNFSSGLLSGRQIDTDDGETGWDLRNTIGETRGCPTQRQVALVGIATDCSYTASFNSSEEARSHIIAQVNSASQAFESSFNISLGIRNITISDRNCPSSPSTSTPWNMECTANVNIGNRLNLFSEWRGDQDDNNAFWSLLSTCESGPSVGVAWLAQACARGSRRANNGQRVAGANVVIRTRSEWQIFAHEAGHIFGAVHDCDETACSNTRVTGQSCCPLSENSCDAGGQFIMNPSARRDISEFSPCSIGNVCFGLRRLPGLSRCLTDNRNVETITDSQCGNGIVEVGEECDCGGDEDCANNPCCDARTCTFIGDAVCDPSNEACCNDQCRFASRGTTCRASTGGCDPEETCPGDTGTCPEDVTLDDGDSCGADEDGLTCASGQCTSRDEQCRVSMGLSSSGNDTTACDTGCRIRCRNPSAFGTDDCRTTNQYFLDGTPCENGGTCRSGDCRRPNRNNVSDFWNDNDHILIPVIASVSGVILLTVVFCCCIAPWLKRRKINKSKDQQMGRPIVAPLYG